MRRAVAILAVLAVMFGLGTPVASAHYVYQKEWWYQSDRMCDYGRAEISHGSGGGYVKSDIKCRTTSW